MEFLDPIVVSCLQWDPSARPSSHSLSSWFLQAAGDIAGAHAHNVCVAGSGSTYPFSTSNSSISGLQHQTGNKPTSGAGSAAQRSKSTVAAVDAADAAASGAASASVTSGTHQSHGGGEVAGTGNPKYGQCTVPGCNNYCIRKRAAVCWRHLPEFMPNELKVAADLAKIGALQLLWPCDLVAAVAHAKVAAKSGFLPFAIVCMLKVPGAITRFMDALVSSGSCTAQSLVRGLRAAWLCCTDTLLLN